MKDFNLSDKIFKQYGELDDMIRVDDVKEFIRLITQRIDVKMLRSEAVSKITSS